MIREGIGGIFKSISIGIILLFAFLVVGLAWWLVPDLVLLIILGFTGLIIFLLALTVPTIKGAGKILAIVLGMVLMFVGIGQAMLTTLTQTGWKSTLDINTDTEPYEKYCYYGEAWLSKTSYVSSMYVNYVGQPINVQGRVQTKWKVLEKCGNHFLPEYYGYKISIYEDGEFRPIKAEEIEHEVTAFAFSNGLFKRGRDWNVDTYRIPNEKINLLGVNFEMKGVYVGAIQAELVIGDIVENHELGWHVKDHDVEATVSIDRAYIHSGYGFTDVTGVINKDGEVINGGTTAEEEGKVIIHVECGAGAWQLRIGKTKTFETSYETIALEEGCWKDIHWDVPKGAFTPSNDSLENQYTVKLLNTVIEQSKDTFFTVDKREYIPDKDDITISADVGYAIVGKDVTLTMTAKANNATNLPIGSFIIWVFYGEYRPGTQFSDEWIADNLVITNVYEISNGTYQATYSFKAHKTGTMTAEIVAIDIDGRASDVVKMKIKAYWNEGDVPFWEGLGIDLFWLIILIIVIPTTAIIIYYAYKKIKRMK